ncbi:MAG: hypothetical protein HUJ54_11015 [Erysipelotrichaceae bacterium]|nr:hypothetical protein [Erysipelotrichaceae bacterium]
MEQMKRMEETLQVKATEAYEYLDRLSKEDPEKYGTFRNPSKRSSQPELSYVQEFHKGFN